jgi:hypothetical protein
MFPGMVEFWASTTSKPDAPDTKVFESMTLHRFIAPHLKEKIPMQLVDSISLNTMATSYNLHFANYSLGKKQVIQLISVTMLKQVYIDYQTIYPNSYLAK